MKVTRCPCYSLKNNRVFSATTLADEKRSDTVGELGSAEICVSHMPSWKAKKLGKLTQEKVLPEL